MKTLQIAAAALAMALVGPALADKGGPGKGKAAHDKHHESAADYAPGKDGKPQFSAAERDEIHGWFRTHPGARDELPPGLAKKGKIPPGWEKKLVRGQRIPDDVWAYRVPLPHEVLVKLPPLPPGVIHVRIQDRVLKVIEKTHEVLDDLGLPHPPTPRSTPPR